MMYLSLWTEKTVYNNDNYYLLAFTKGDFRTYRVDRMASVEQSVAERQRREEFEKMDMPAYTKATFGMYNGKVEKVTMIFHNRMPSLTSLAKRCGFQRWTIGISK